MLDEQTHEPPLESLDAVARADEVIRLAERAREVFVEDSLSRYVVALLRQTRSDSRLYLGASPRSGIALLRVAKARALADGRDYLVPDDVKAVAGAGALAPAHPRPRGALGRPRRRGDRRRGAREDARPGMTSRGRAVLALGARRLPRGLGLRLARRSIPVGDRARPRRRRSRWLGPALVPAGAREPPRRRARPRRGRRRLDLARGRDERRRCRRRRSSRTSGPAASASAGSSSRRRGAGTIPPGTSSPACRAAGTRSTPSGSRSRTRSRWRAPSSCRASRRRSSSIRGSCRSTGSSPKAARTPRRARRLLLQRPTGLRAAQRARLRPRRLAPQGALALDRAARAADGEGARGCAARRGGRAARRRRGAQPLGDSFDVAVRAAGSILQAHHRRGRRCALVVNSAARETQADRVRCELAARARDPRRRGADRAHARVRTSAGRRGHRRALARARRRHLARRRHRSSTGSFSVRSRGAACRSCTSRRRPARSRSCSGSRRSGFPVAVVRGGDDLAAALGAPEARVA